MEGENCRNKVKKTSITEKCLMIQNLKSKIKIVMIGFDNDINIQCSN